MAIKQNIFEYFKDIISEVLKSLFEKLNFDVANEFIDYNLFSVEFPKNKEYGDLSTNAALVYNAAFKIPPRELAMQIVQEFHKCEHKIVKYITNIEIAGPGFINFSLDKEFWQSFLKTVLELNLAYGDNNVGHGEHVNVEFVSANPTGPLHVGHSRGAIYGDAIVRLMRKSGYNVTSEYLINDYGKQIEALIKSFWVRYREQLGIKNISINECEYPGEYLIDLAKEVVAQNGDKFLHIEDNQRNEMLRNMVLNYMMQLIRDDLKLIGVKHDIFISERDDLVDKKMVEKAIEILDSKGLLYRGILDAPKSKVIEDWEPKEQLLLKATKFGDEIDRPVLRADGSGTYFSSDLGYHLNKLQRGFNKMVLLLGSDHGGYVKRMEAAVAALSDGKAHIEILVNQLVNLVEDGKAIKMSKRKGNFVTIRDIVEILGKDILRFAMLMKKNTTVLDLDVIKVKEQSKDNPVYYVQYAHTRCVSILSKAYDVGVINKNEMAITEGEDADGSVKLNYIYDHSLDIDLSLLNDASEIKTIKEIALFPKIIEAAVINYEPHRLSYYLYDLANMLHNLWAAGLENSELRFVLPENRKLSRARLALVFALASVIGNGLQILGVKPLLRL